MGVVSGLPLPIEYFATEVAVATTKLHFGKATNKSACGYSNGKTARVVVSPRRCTGCCANSKKKTQNPKLKFSPHMALVIVVTGHKIDHTTVLETSELSFSRNV